MSSYQLAREFLKKYPMTIAWRLKKHCEVIDKHLNQDEKVLYVFAGQKNDSASDLVNTNVIAITDRRIMIATKRVLFGYFFKSITPDLYNDLTVSKGLIFGKVVIDTVKEVVTLTNIDPRALDEIESNITEIMIKQKKEYVNESRNQD